MSIHNILVPNNLDIFARSITADASAVSGDFDVDGNLNVDGAAVIDTSLTVGTTISTQSLTVSSNIATNGLNVGPGNANFANMFATGNFVLAGNMTADQYQFPSPGIALTSGASSIQRARFWQGLCPIYSNASISTGTNVSVKISRVNNVVTLTVDPFSVLMNFEPAFFVAIRLPSIGVEPLLVPSATNVGSSIVTIGKFGVPLASYARILENLGFTYVAFYDGLSPVDDFATGDVVSSPGGFSLSYPMTN